MKILLKVPVLSVTCFLTWWATSAIIAQPPEKGGLAQVESFSKTTVYVPGNDPAPIKLGASNALAEMHLRSGAITVTDGIATVSAHVSMADTRNGMSYVWRLRVVTPEEIPLAGQVYADQMFSVDANGQKEVDFLDQVEIPPGSRRVELVLYGKPPGRDLSFLNDNSTARGYEVIRLAKVLTN